MSMEFNQLRELLQQQQKQFEEAQLKLIESLTTSKLSDVCQHPQTEGQKVLVRDYSGRRPAWIPGLILRRRGKVLYEIQVGPARWIRHTNQIRPTGAQILPSGPSELSLEMLLDTFDLGTIPENPSAASSEARPEHGLQPRRWTDRIRKPVRPLQVNPRPRSYFNKLRGGGVRRNSTQIPLYRPQSGAASAKKPIPHKIDQEFGTLAGPASSPALIGRKSGPNSQS
ncbi:hypothetical protein CLF_103414 [Clonorchis sinensis]|uniref:Uncharacterized protein n=1 Tax=Clonorchis sinensis TaxID=79923 RepID=G7YNG1_CLOSI|nr:hypothetical protein CLF_103414 [Clonorchis sinensis]